MLEYLDKSAFRAVMKAYSEYVKGYSADSNKLLSIAVCVAKSK